MALAILGGILASMAGTPPDTYYVAPDGSDDPRNGSAIRPWASITYAVKRAPDGSAIVVRPGTYRGRVGLGRRFIRGVVVRSEVPYQAQLRHRGLVVLCYGCAGITIEGFDVAHDGPGAGPLVIQIDGQGSGAAERVVIRNNIFHDSFNNDLLKINNSAHHVVVQGNVFYNQQGRDEHIDVNSAEDVVIEDNLLFNDFAGAGRAVGTDTGAFIVVKDSNADEDKFLGSRRVLIRRNVFLGWQGGRAYGFVLLGEDGKPYYEASDVTVENNLMLGNSSYRMRAPFAVKGCRRATFRNNTVVGDLPAAAFAARLNREGDNHAPTEISFFNNVWADPTGTMTDFSDAARREVGSVSTWNNLYWNGGTPIPADSDDVLSFTRDGKAIVADPKLADPRAVVAPRWIAERARFADGARTIEEARLNLIERYGRPLQPSALIDRAEPGRAPADDIRGKPRGSAPDIGAYEVEPAR